MLNLLDLMATSHYLYEYTKECFYDTPPMPATVSQPTPRLFGSLSFSCLSDLFNVDIFFKENSGRT